MTSSRSRWALCGMLFLATTLNYLDRQTLGILAPLIQKEMGLDNEALGWLFSGFYYAYTFAQFAVGAGLDRWHLRWAYGIAVLAWSATASLTALSVGFASLMAFRLLLGVMEAVNWPAAMRVVARALPPHERSLGNGIFTSGTSVGALIAPGLILGIAGLYGWRWSFVAVGALGAVWFVGWVLFTRGEQFRAVWRKGPEELAAEAGSASSPGEDYRAILTAPQFWRVFAVAVLVNPCLYFQVNWLPTYFAQQHGLTAATGLGGVLTLIYVGLDLGYLTCGAAVLGLTRSGRSLAQARSVVFLAATLLLALSAAVPALPSLRAAVTALVLVNVGAGAWIAMYLTMAQEVSPTRVSTAAGLLGGSGSLAGAFAMWAVGRVSKDTGSFAAPMMAVAVAAGLAFLAGLAVVRARESQERVLARVPQ